MAVQAGGDPDYSPLQPGTNITGGIKDVRVTGKGKVVLCKVYRGGADLSLFPVIQGFNLLK